MGPGPATAYKFQGIGSMSSFTRRLALAVALSCGVFAAQAQVSLTAPGVAATQSFDALPATGSATLVNNATLPGWYFARTGNGTTIVANNGGSNAGAVYSYGTADAPDRALGSLGSSNAAAGSFFWGVRLQNNTGAVITTLTVSYTGEQWRNSAAAAQAIAFSYLVGSPAVTGSLTEFQTAGVAVPALDFTSPVTAGTAGAIDGNAAGNRNALTATITGLSIPVGAEVMLRWSDPDHTGSDHGLSIDEFSVAANGTGGPVTPSLGVSDTSAAEGDSGTKPFFFTFTLDTPAGPGGVSFVWQTRGGTAMFTSPPDLQPNIANLTIPEGMTSATVSVNIIGDTLPEADETFFIDVSDVTGAVVAKGTGNGVIVNDDVVLTPISQIQGSGATSPVVGQIVYTRGIVTGRRSAGYYIQTADGEDDGSDATSEGLYVFTNAAPPADAAVGNLVQVQGSIAEFIPTQDLGQLPLTEMVSSTVTVLGTGNALPQAKVLSTTLPSPAGPIDQLERFEGMRVTAPSFTVVAPTGGNTNEPNATGTSNGIFSIVVTGTPRPFREPGIQAPDLPPTGSIPPIPRFDYNPETLTVTSRTLGGPALDVRAGTVITGLLGPLDYSFRHYTILPDPAVTPVIGAQPGPTPARLPTSDEFTIASYNAERFFDTTNDPAVGEPVLTDAAFANRLNKASLAIRNFLNTPDIIGLVEIENLSTLQSIASKVNGDAVAAGQPDPQYAAYLQEGNDVGGIDVGFLVKTAAVTAGVSRVDVVAVTQLGKDTMFVQPDNTSALLNDRPPLQLDAVVHYADGRVFPITAMVIHNRSLNGANGSDANGDRVRVKRQKQAEFVAQQVQLLQDADPTRRIALMGDFNAFEFNDGFGDSMGTITGLPSPDNQTVVPDDGGDLVQPDLLNLFVLETTNERYSYVFDGNAQSLDHILVNQALGTAAGGIALDHARINADFTEVDRNDANAPTRLSDHDPAVAYITADPVTFADLSTTASATPTSVAVGSAMRFDVTVANGGPAAADFPGLGLAFDAVLPNLAVTAPTGWNCDVPVVTVSNTSVACAATTLASAANAAFVLAATAPASEAGQSINLSASATSQTADNDAANDNATATVAVAMSADLSITLSGGDTAPRSVQPVNYIATVVNAGPNAAPQASVRLVADTQAAFVTLTPPTGWTCVAVVTTRKFDSTCTTTTPIASGGARRPLVMKPSVNPAPPPLLLISGSVTSAANDPVIGNNTFNRRITVSSAR